LRHRPNHQNHNRIKTKTPKPRVLVLVHAYIYRISSLTKSFFRSRRIISRVYIYTIKKSELIIFRRTSSSTLNTPCFTNSSNH
jgi:hypothetical protein